MNSVNFFNISDIRNHPVLLKRSADDQSLWAGRELFEVAGPLKNGLSNDGDSFKVQIQGTLDQTKQRIKINGCAIEAEVLRRWVLPPRFESMQVLDIKVMKLQGDIATVWSECTLVEFNLRIPKDCLGHVKIGSNYELSVLDSVYQVKAKDKLDPSEELGIWEIPICERKCVTP